MGLSFPAFSTLFCPKFLSEMPSDCQTVWIQIRSEPDQVLLSPL